MTSVQILEYCALTGLGFGLALMLWRLAGRGQTERPAGDDPPGTNLAARFVFCKGILVSANGPAETLIDKAETQINDWPSLAGHLKLRFHDIPDILGLTRDRLDRFQAKSRLDAAEITIRRRGEFTDVTLLSPQKKPTPSIANLQLSSQTAAQIAPYPIWQTNPAGEVQWSNLTFDQLTERIGQIPVLPTRIPEQDDDEITPHRVDLGSGQGAFWFDVTSVKSGENALHFATDAGATVRAEAAQRNFVQTLTKTFANLSIGLAIFDRNRQLALFNPALIDLTALAADFLSSRPNLLTFFDRMRDNRTIPEPKNYSSWRERIAELVAAASDDRFSENWTLPSGLTYRVSGRPHPDGAIAFLFEDISAEISLTRRFRADLELGQSVLDSVDDAIAVFSPNGVLAMCNTPYCVRWSVDPETGFAEYSLHDAIRDWQKHTGLSDPWDKIHDLVLDERARSEFSQIVTPVTGDPFRITLKSVNGGATMTIFETVA